MTHKSMKRGLAVVVTLCCIFTAHQVIRRWFIEDTTWLVSIPLWVFILAGIAVWILLTVLLGEWLIRTAVPLDPETEEKIERYFRERRRLERNARRGYAEDESGEDQ